MDYNADKHITKLANVCVFRPVPGGRTFWSETGIFGRNDKSSGGTSRVNSENGRAALVQTFRTLVGLDEQFFLLLLSPARGMTHSSSLFLKPTKKMGWVVAALRARI